MARGLLLLVIISLNIFLPSPAHADNGRAFLADFYKIDVFDPPLELDDLFFSRSDDQAPWQMTDEKGHWLIMNLWATWCSPCIAELPSLNRLARVSGDGFNVAAVSVDRKMDANRIAYYLKRWRVEAIKPLHDTVGILPGRLDTKRLPVTYIVDPQGQAHAALYGRAKWETEAAQAFLAAVRTDPTFFAPYVNK